MRGVFKTRAGLKNPLGGLVPTINEWAMLKPAGVTELDLKPDS
jgi:hypothetical protein